MADSRYARILGRQAIRGSFYGPENVKIDDWTAQQRFCEEVITRLRLVESRPRDLKGVDLLKWLEERYATEPVLWRTPNRHDNYEWTVESLSLKESLDLQRRLSAGEYASNGDVEAQLIEQTREELAQRAWMIDEAIMGVSEGISGYQKSLEFAKEERYKLLLQLLDERGLDLSTEDLHLLLDRREVEATKVEDAE